MLRSRRRLPCSRLHVDQLPTLLDGLGDPPLGDTGLTDFHLLVVDREHRVFVEFHRLLEILHLRHPDSHVVFFDVTCPGLRNAVRREQAADLPVSSFFQLVIVKISIDVQEKLDQLRALLQQALADEISLRVRWSGGERFNECRLLKMQAHQVAEVMQEGSENVEELADEIPSFPQNHQGGTALAQGQPPHNPFLTQKFSIDRVTTVRSHKNHAPSLRVFLYLGCKVPHVIIVVNVPGVILSVAGSEVVMGRGRVELVKTKVMVSFQREPPASCRLLSPPVQVLGKTSWSSANICKVELVVVLGGSVVDDWVRVSP
mmetsp:Transcript_15671/g.35901  ORF Transcript_15671/g.35901 Transcript_15671/m.35901 type:complete len:316 (+) Transcript_15671:769-1716(+)